MRRATFLFFMLLQLPSANADMILTIREVGDDLEFNLRGSIDTSVFSSVGFASSQASGFARSEMTNVYGSDGAMGTGTHTQLNSPTSNGYTYWLPDDMAMMPLGSFPIYSRVTRLRRASPFWFGYSDLAQSLGPPNTIVDRVVLPAGYESGSTVNLSFLEPNKDFSSLKIIPGDFWGVSFTDGKGGTQSVLFHALPEPASLIILLAALFVSCPMGIRG